MDEVCFHWGVWLALLGELSASVVRKCWYVFSLYFISWKLVRGRCSYSNTHPGLELLLSNKDHHFLCLQEWNSWHWRRSKYLLLPVLQLHDFLLYLNCTYVQIALLALPQLLWQLYVHYLTQLKGHWHSATQEHPCILCFWRRKILWKEVSHHLQHHLHLTFCQIRIPTGAIR